MFGEEWLNRGGESLRILEEAEVIRVRDDDEARGRNRACDEAGRLDGDGIELAVHYERRAGDRPELSRQIVLAEVAEEAPRRSDDVRRSDLGESVAGPKRVLAFAEDGA